MRAAIEHPGMLGAMTDHLAAAMCAGRRQHMDGALEGIEGMRFAISAGDGEGLVVIVTAHCTGGHRVVLERVFEDAALAGHGG